MGSDGKKALVVERLCLRGRSKFLARFLHRFDDDIRRLRAGQGDALVDDEEGHAFHTDGARPPILFFDQIAIRITGEICGHFIAIKAGLLRDLRECFLVGQIRAFRK